MSKQNKVFKTFEELQQEVRNSLYYSKGYWINRTVSHYQCVNRRRIPRLCNILRDLYFL